MSPGVPAGATSMNQDTASNSLTPISVSGGTSGIASIRSTVVTPSMRSLPACANGCANGIGLNMNGMWPPATSLMAGDMPL